MARDQVRKKPPAKGGPTPLPSDGALIRDGKIVADDPWTFLADGEDGPEIGDIVLPLHRYLAERDALVGRKGRLGVLIGAGDEVEDIAQDIHRFDLIAVAFPAFRDGRGFTSGRLLRERYGYRGELRAVGDVLSDLLFYMLRCGFTSFTLRGPDPEAAFARAARTFSRSYQGASDGRKAVSALRAERRGA